MFQINYPLDRIYKEEDRGRFIYDKRSASYRQIAIPVHSALDIERHRKLIDKKHAWLREQEKNAMSIR